MKRPLLVALLLLVSPVRADGPAVVASIAPLHSLLSGVMADVSEPHLLVRGGASPHTYTLRPSDMRALEKVVALFWIGEGLENFLMRPLASLRAQTPVVAAAHIEGVRLLPAREGGSWEGGDGHTDHGAGEHRHGDEHGSDPHLWLDPRNAAAIVATMADILAEVDPANAPRYRANARELAQRLAELEAELHGRLAPVRDRPYLVFHDAYRYFETRFQLSPAGAVTIGPETRPGAARLTAIRERLRQTNARCVFAEPQFRSSAVQVVVEGTGARIGVLDPVGADLKPGDALYFDLLRRLADSLVDCLGD